jgi:hypothetical protein
MLKSRDGKNDRGRKTGGCHLPFAVDFVWTPYSVYGVYSRWEGRGQPTSEPAPAPPLEPIGCE